MISASAPDDRVYWRQAWLAVAGTALVQLIVMGTSLYSFGVLVKPLAAEFQVGRAPISAAFMLFTLVGALFGPFAGAQLAIRSIRLIMLIGVALMGVGFLLLSQAQALWQVYLCFGGLVGAGNLLAGSLPCSAVVVKWFDANRGTALGVSLFGATLGGPIFVTLATMTEVAFGWRWTAAGFGGLIFLLLPPIILLLIREPTKMSKTEELPADGLRTPVKAGDARQLLRDRKLWLAIGLLGFGITPAIAVIQTLHAQLTDAGHTPELAAAAVAGMTFISALSKPLFGRLADRFGPHFVVLLALALQGIALVLLSHPTNVVLVFAGAGFIGLGYGGLTPLMSLLLSLLFGQDRFPKVAGLLTTALLPFSLMGFPLASLIQDRVGSYSPAYLLFVLFLALSAACLVGLRLRVAAPTHGERRAA